MADDSSPTLKAAAAGAWISAIILIVILVGLFFGWFTKGVGVSGGIFAAIRNFFSGLFNVSWIGGKLGQGGASIISILAAVVLFIPDTAVLGGFIADAVNAQFRYSVPSIAALVSAILNWAVSFKTDGGPIMTEYILGSPLSDTIASTTSALPNTSASSSSGSTGGLFAGWASAIAGSPNPPAGPKPSTQPRAPTAIGYGVDPTSGATAALSSAATAATAATAAVAAAPAPVSAALSLDAARRSSAARSVVSNASRPAAPGALSTVSTAPLGGRKQAGGGKLTGSHTSILGIPLGSKSQPAGLAVLATIVMIYTLDAASGKRTGAALAVQVSIGIFTLLAYWISYYFTEGFANPILSITPIVIGIAIGTATYYIFSKNHPLDPEGSSPTPSGEYSKCSAGGGNGEFVCDAYLNGVRIGTVPT